MGPNAGVRWEDKHGPLIKDLIHALDPRARIAYLAYTGSRVFGWGGERYDIDVRGAVARKNWWTSAHHGERLYDMTIIRLEKTFKMLTSYWTIYEDSVNDFYVDPEFDHDGMISFCSAENVRNHLHTMRLQANQLNFAKNPRTALHSYRLYICPIHFLRTGEVKTNAMELNESYDDFGFEQMRKCRDRYRDRKNAQINYDIILEDMKVLDTIAVRELDGRDDKFDTERFNIWKDNMMSAMYQ